MWAMLCDGTEILAAMNALLFMLCISEFLQKLNHARPLPFSADRPEATVIRHLNLRLPQPPRA